MINQKELIAKIALIKNPTIFMNESDLRSLINPTELSTKVKITGDPKFYGVPVKSSPLLKKGEYRIIDNVLSCGCKITCTEKSIEFSATCPHFEPKAEPIYNIPK